MSMNGAGSLNHNIQHDTSEKPSDYPTTTTTLLWQIIGWCRILLAPKATVAGAKSLYICIKKTSYEYEVGGGYQSYVTVEPHLMSL
jgi:hypothetical protein